MMKFFNKNYEKMLKSLPSLSLLQFSKPLVILKVERNRTKMGVVSDVKQQLREVNARNIFFSATTKEK